MSSPETAALKKELSALKSEILILEEKGEEIACVSQLSIEASWVLKSKGDVSRTRALIGELRAELAKSSRARRIDLPSPIDGSWGTCFHEWVFKVADSGEHILELAERGRAPSMPLALLDRINSPERLTTYLESMLISDAPPALPNHRRELNESISILLRLITAGLPSNYKFHPDLKATLLKFVNEHWQDPETGYWGEWYRASGGLTKTTDLSITFHIASYLGGDVAHLDRIFATTLAIRDETYPLGWLERGAYFNHHNYDVVRLLRYSWPHASATDQTVAAREIRKMLDWFLKESITSEGFIRISDADDSIEDAYYFAVSFLDEIGFFDRTKQFWSSDSLPDSKQIRSQLIRNIRATMGRGGKSGLYFRNALKKLESSGQPRAADR